MWTRGGKRRELKRGSGQARAVAKTEHFNAHLLSSLLFLLLLFVSKFLRFAQSFPPLLFLPVPPISGGFNKDKTDTGLNHDAQSHDQSVPISILCFLLTHREIKLCTRFSDFSDQRHFQCTVLVGAGVCCPLSMFVYLLFWKIIRQDPFFRTDFQGNSDFAKLASLISHRCQWFSLQSIIPIVHEHSN